MAYKYTLIQKERERFLHLLKTKNVSYVARAFNTTRQYVYILAKKLDNTYQPNFDTLKNKNIRKDLQTKQYSIKELAKKYNVSLSTIYYQQKKLHGKKY